MNALPPDFPVRAAGYCVDPRIDVRNYGAFAKAPLDAVCAELFKDECELYKTYGLEGVRTLQYASSTSDDHGVSVVVSEFRTSQGAYGFLMQRIHGGGAPEAAKAQPLEVPGQGALHVDVAYARRGRQVVELTYVSRALTPGELRSRAQQALPELARAITQALGGDVEVPSVARRIALPELPKWGLELPPDALFGLTGTGPYAVAHFERPEPHRLFCIESADEASAKDTMRLLATAGTVKKSKGSDVTTLRVADERRPPEQWFLLRQDRLIVGVGPAMTTPYAVLQGPARKRADEAWTAFATKRIRAAMKHARAVGR